MIHPLTKLFADLDERIKASDGPPWTHTWTPQWSDAPTTVTTAKTRRRVMSRPNDPYPAR